MPASAFQDRFAPRELFRYVRISPPRVIDLGARARKVASLKAVLERTERERVEWARDFLRSAKRIVSPPDLKFDYFAHLSLDHLPPDRLPTRRDLKDPRAFPGPGIRSRDDYRADLEACLLTVLALRIDGAGRNGDAQVACRLLDFVETFPDLRRVKRARGYAPVLLERQALGKPRPLPAPMPPPSRDGREDPQSEADTGELARLSEGLLLLWNARNQRMREKKAEFDKAYREVIRSRRPAGKPKAVPAGSVAPSGGPDGADGSDDGMQPVGRIRFSPSMNRLFQRARSVMAGRPGRREGGAEWERERQGEDRERLRGPDGAGRPERPERPHGPDIERQPDRMVDEEARARAEAHAESIRERMEGVKALKQDYEASKGAAGLRSLLDGEAAGLARHLEGMSEAQAAQLVKALKDAMEKYGIRTGRFCEAYEQAMRKLDLHSKAKEVGSGGCFKEYPDMAFADAVRILGRGELVRVDETFVKYTPGEISYVENILAGESRKREVKSAKYFEQAGETSVEEEQDVSKETSVSSTQELSTQVESELRTRFQSDIGASAGASGGGSLGVIDLQGGANIDASLGLGVDTSLGTGSESDFTQEIVSKALEKTRKTTLERRTTRSYALYESFDHHGIENTAGDAQHRNGIYCFLDKHVAITETVYGRRLFLLANIRLPGSNLLCARTRRIRMSLEELGTRPSFEISPADITPSTYLDLAGRFKASNIEPPPPPVSTLARTWKTDTTNANLEQQEIDFKKVADVLAPFFARYKRHLLIENVRIPEGYEVQDVTVTVNHGGNGLSIPAHLPLSLAGASIYMAPSLAAHAMYGPFLIPYWLWQVVYLASPLMHYNADSSNVTVSVGNESLDSPYYFFPPDFLIQEVFDLVGSLSGLLPDLMAQIQESAEALFEAMKAKAQAMPEEIRAAVTGSVGSLIGSLEGIFKDILNGNLQAMWTKVTGLTATFDVAGLNELMGDFFGPIQDFIQGVIDLVDSGIGSTLSGFFSFLGTLFESSQHLPFHGAAGSRGEVSVSLNVISIHPGITINLTACLRRTDEALDKWRLRTFNSLYQGHLQLLADWENRAFMAGKGEGPEKHPAMLRAEEHAALKEKVLHALNIQGGAEGNAYTLERMNVLEHAIDWRNMSYRVFTYGPNLEEIKLEKLGAYAGADAKRKAFLRALWAQALIPVRADDRLEGQMFRYFDNGRFDFEGNLENEELVALYQDMVMERETDHGDPGEPTFAVVPTEFVVINTPDLETQLPRNEALAAIGP